MEVQSRDLLGRIRASEHLPTLSAVAIEVLRLTRDAKTSAKDLALVIEKDPALSLRILRLVNSAFVGMSREIGSIQRAVVVLGLRTTTLLTLGFSLATNVGSPVGTGFDYRTYWRRSIIQAVAARLLAREVASSMKDEAFIAGLLADVGIVAAWQCAPDAYGDVVKALHTPSEPLYEIEDRVLGVNHARISEDLLEHWSLPVPVCRAVSAHHGSGLESLEGANRELANVTLAAGRIAAHVCGDPPAFELSDLRKQLRDDLPLTEDALTRVFDAMQEQVEEVASLLSVNIDTTIGAMMQAQATLRAAQLTHEMETECAELAQKEASARQRADRLVEDQKAVIQAASTDCLTGLKNRAVFDRELDASLARAGRTKQIAALLLMDLDFFKQINDTFGHAAGDCVLRGVGRVLSGMLREVDVAVRYGGEEFAIITEHDSHVGAGLLAERIRTAMAEEEFSHKQDILPVTASIGVACWRGGGNPVKPEILVEMADKALYAAKREGRNQVRMVHVM